MAGRVNGRKKARKAQRIYGWRPNIPGAVAAIICGSELARDNGPSRASSLPQKQSADYG
jgi:hypothetical protein